MSKRLQLSSIAASLFFVSTGVQAQDIEIPPIERPQIEPTIEISKNLGVGFIDGVAVADKNTIVELDNVQILTYGLSLEKTLLREPDYSINAALSGEAGFGKGSNLEINSLESSSDAEYQRLQAYGDIIARYDAGDETNWTPFLAAGVGIVEERITLDDFEGDTQSFKALTPKARFGAGVEKKLSKGVTIGAGVRQTVDLD